MLFAIAAERIFRTYEIRTEQLWGQPKSVSQYPTFAPIPLLRTKPHHMNRGFVSIYKKEYSPFFW